MSAINGDKARFHRERKQKIQRRIRNRKMFADLAKPPVLATIPLDGKTEVRPL
jgi:hypothetical protein